MWVFEIAVVMVVLVASVIVAWLVFGGGSGAGTMETVAWGVPISVLNEGGTKPARHALWPLPHVVPRSKIARTRRSAEAKARVFADVNSPMPQAFHNSEREAVARWDEALFGLATAPAAQHGPLAYEMLARGCVPVVSVDETSMINFPKALVAQAQALLPWKGNAESRNEYDRLAPLLHKHVAANMTCEALANFVLQQFEPRPTKVLLLHSAGQLCPMLLLGLKTVLAHPNATEFPAAQILYDAPAPPLNSARPEKGAKEEFRHVGFFERTRLMPRGWAPTGKDATEEGLRQRLGSGGFDLVIFCVDGPADPLPSSWKLRPAQKRAFCIPNALIAIKDSRVDPKLGAWLEEGPCFSRHLKHVRAPHPTSTTATLTPVVAS